MTPTPTPSPPRKPRAAVERHGVLPLAAQAETMPAGDPRRTAASVAMLERLSEHWSLRGDERETLLGGVPKSTWSEWRQRPALARIKADTRERIANLFTIDLNAHALFAAEFADRWVREPNAAFAGDSPMSAMLHGRLEDVITVRRYLERIRSSSPSAALRPDRVRAEKALAVSYLPGDAVTIGDEDTALSTLRQAAAIYESLALQLQQAALYRPALAAALSALGTRLEEHDDAEAVPVLRRAFEMQSQVATAQPAHGGTIDDLHPAPADGSWRTGLEPRAANVIVAIGMLDANFNPALLVRLREIERDPFASPPLSEGGETRIAHMTYRGVTWTLAYVVSEAERRVHIVSLEVERSTNG